MYRFENLLVNLSLTETDVPLLRMAGLVSRLARSRTVTFLYARQTIEIPEPLKTEYPWLFEPIHDAAEKRANVFLAEHFSTHPDCATRLRLLDAPVATATLEIALSESIDLILCGDSDLDRSLAIKLARKAPCSILMVPARSSGDFHHISVGIDFSRFADYTLDVATAFASKRGGSRIDFVSYYAIPDGFNKTNLPRERFQQELHEYTQRRLEVYLEKRDLSGVDYLAMAVASPVPGSTLLHKAEKDTTDLIVVGCRGKDALTATLLGSNAEDIIRGTQKAAVLAVKEKGTGRSFLENLLGLEPAEGAR